MQNLEKLNKAELEKLLRNLRLYNDLIKKVWKRGRTIYDNIFKWVNSYTVEYFSILDEDYVLTEAIAIYKKIFNLDVKKEDIKLIKNENIKWWIKVYLNDSLIDLSFLKFYNLLKK